MPRDREIETRYLLLMVTRPLFDVGRIVATPGALDAVSRDEMSAALTRHRRGDWGDIEHEDRAANDRAVAEGGRVFSVYTSAKKRRFYLITEADRSVTTFLLPEEY